MRGSRGRMLFVLGSIGAGLIVALLVAGMAAASSNGISGYSGNPATNGGATCNACHSGGVAPTVTLSGPTTVNVGDTNTYSLTVAGGQAVAGGLDVSVTGGVLAAGGDTKLLSGEVVHTAPKGVDASGAVSWSFSWTAPATAGSVTMYGAGNSVNGGQGTNGDAGAATSLAITVQSSANQAPAADPGGPYTGDKQQPVGFDGTGSTDSDGTIASYAWDFGDGSSASGGTGFAKLWHSYNQEGIFTVILTVTDDAGATSTATTTATIGTVATTTTTVPATTTTTAPATTTTLPSAVNGAAVYAANCAGCHGSNGEGGFGPSLQASTLSTAQIAAVVSNGQGTMPGFAGSLSPAEIDAVAAHSRSLQSPTAPATTTTTLAPTASGSAVYAARCAGCHGGSGQGGVGPSLQVSTLSTSQIATVVRNGQGTMSGFSGTLTAAQINAVAAYARGLQSSSATTTTLASTADVAQVFAGECAGCHGVQGEGGIAPPLAGSGLTAEEIAAIITEGKGTMPAFGSRLSEEQIGGLAVFVLAFGATADLPDGDVGQAETTTTTRVEVLATEVDESDSRGMSMGARIALVLFALLVLAAVVSLTQYRRRRRAEAP